MHYLWKEWNYLWPEQPRFTRELAPDDAILHKMDRALDPIRPLVRGIKFVTPTPNSRLIVVSLGSEGDVVNIIWTATSPTILCFCTVSRTSDPDDDVESLGLRRAMEFDESFHPKDNLIEVWPFDSGKVHLVDRFSAFESEMGATNLPILALKVLTVWREKLIGIGGHFAAERDDEY